MHKGQLRHSGEPYFTHPVAVAHILAGWHLEDLTIATALLHDTLEDTKSNYPEIQARFGNEIARFVDGVTKLTNIEFSTVESKTAENLRKLLYATAADIRVLVVKLADRLHNMRTIEHLPPVKQKKKATETLDIFAPLAGRIGMQDAREEMEDLAFSVLGTRERDSILWHFELLKSEDDKPTIRDVKDEIRRVVGSAGENVGILSRRKKPYSIWRKMKEKGIGFGDVLDAYGFRVLTEKEEEVYRILGAIHMKWPAVPGRFKDYISQPKPNGYRSLHTVVTGCLGYRVEIQIRTYLMNEVAEKGAAAHWSYRDGVPVDNPYLQDPVKSLHELTHNALQAEDAAEFMEHLKFEIKTDRVYCFTPEGEVVNLPKGATPLDFAYAIHTDLGNHCIAAEVDGRRQLIGTELRNGQTVKILASEKIRRPRPELEIVAKTGRAKTALRRFNREIKREGKIKHGRRVAKEEFEQANKTLNTNGLNAAAPRLHCADAEELLVKIGMGELTGHDVLMALYPEEFSEPDSPSEEAKDPLVGLPKGRRGILAHCCNPIPGEKVVGIQHRHGFGVSVHSRDCGRLRYLEDREWITLTWRDGIYPAVHVVDFQIVLANRAGALGRVCTLIGEQKANIIDLRITNKETNTYKLMIGVEVRDLEHWHNVKISVAAEQDVIKIIRKRDIEASA